MSRPVGNLACLLEGYLIAMGWRLVDGKWFAPGTKRRRNLPSWSLLAAAQHQMSYEHYERFAAERERVGLAEESNGE